MIIFFKFFFSWVNEKTQGKIKEMISDVLPASTKAVITSALYFSALWERTFMEGATKSYVSSLIFQNLLLRTKFVTVKTIEI